MTKKMKKLTRGRVSALALTAALTLAIGVFAGQAKAGTVENMERERAILIETLLDADLEARERAGQVEISRHRLVDLERMVLRDDKLRGRNTPTVRRAFENYDLTFLVHAAAEKNASIVDMWMEQLGLTTQAVLSARRSRR